MEGRWVDGVMQLHVATDMEEAQKDTLRHTVLDIYISDWKFLTTCSAVQR
jgi:hypothetical protein